MYSMDSWEHLEHLKKVVQAHTKAEIKIQPKKRKIFQSKVEILGHTVHCGLKVSRSQAKNYENFANNF